MTRGWLLAALVAGACGARAVDVPLPDLAGAEPAVRAKIESRRAAVLAAPGAESWRAYGRALHAHGRFAQAERAWLEAVAAAGKDLFDELHCAGIAAIESLAPTRALGHFQRALAVRSDYAPTFLHLAQLEERLGRLADARAHYQRALALRPISHARTGLARLALRERDARAALEQARAALALDPKDGGAHEVMARAWAQLGNVDESRAAARRAGDFAQRAQMLDEVLQSVAEEDVSYGALLARVPLLIRTERFQEAVDSMDLALQARPGDAKARVQRAYALGRLGRADEAIAGYGEVLRDDPGNVEARHYLGEARAKLDAILARDPDHKDALALRASILLAAGERERAEHDLRALLRVDPGNGWARARLGK